jgi:hypothetical protein
LKLVELRRFLFSAVGLLLAACGDSTSGTPSRGRFPEPAPWVGQEIWLTYHSPEHAMMGRRVDRTREEAKALAESLRARVARGEDIGALAGEHSNAPGGAALGFSSWLGGRSPPDPRDRAMAQTPIGELTEIVEWNGGWWFARRVSKQRGLELQALFEKAMRKRAKFEAIAVVWKGAYGLTDEDVVTRTKEEALARAQEALARAKQGADFHDLVREFSDDPYSRERGGLVVVMGPDRQPTEWVRPQEPWLPAPLLEAVFSAPVGRVHPEVILTQRGIFVIRVLAREGDQ